MTNRRNIAIAAAVSCVLAAPLAFGPYAAQADELSDMRANQKLLDQRLDQLAQTPGKIPGKLYPYGPAAKSAGKAALGGSFPRSFRIPGTDTSLRIGGAIRMMVTHFFTGGAVHHTGDWTNLGNNGANNGAPLHLHVSSISPVTPAGNPHRSLGNDLTFFSPQQSKLNIETRTPTAWGEARTFMEFDWAGGPSGGSLRSTNSLHPRLRYAYATLGGLLGGQANSNFSDPDAGPTSINFGGMVGSRGVTRIPQVRYTMALQRYGLPGAWSVSAEAPLTEGFYPGGASAGGNASSSDGNPNSLGNPFKAASPDLTTAWYIPQPWGHLDFGAVLRPALQVKDGQHLDRTRTGWGIAFSGDVKPHWFGWNKDFITWQFEYGDGIGHYIGGNNTMLALVTNYPGQAATTTKALANQVRVGTVTAFGGNTSYRHYWRHDLQSNIAFGIQHMDIPNLGGPFGFVCSGAARFSVAGSGCTVNKELMTAEVNLIWHPVSFADLGIEYLWGHRIVKSDLKGDVNGIIGAFRMNF